MSKTYDNTFSRDTIYDDETYKQVVAKYKDANDYSGIMVLKVDREPIKSVVYVNLAWQMLSPKKGMGIFNVFSAGGIPIRNIPNRDDTKDPRAENEGLRLAIAFKKNDCGIYGEAMSIFGKAWLQETARLQEEIKSKTKKELTTSDATVRSSKICLYGRTHFSEKNLEHAGEEMDDEIFSYKIDFGTFPEKHPYGTAGAPKFELYDARTKKGNVAGKSFASYSLATIPRIQSNGTVVNEPITADNIHEFVTTGSKVILQKYVANSPSASQFGFALKNMIWKTVILPGSGNVPDDECEEEEADNNMSSQSNIMVVDVAKPLGKDENAEDLLDDLI